MKRKKIALFVMSIATTLSLTCCNSDSTNTEENTTSAASTERVAQNIPERFKEGYGETTSVVPKATGYEYDRESLTYDLVWSDEFDGDELNTDDWTYEIGMGQWGWGNNELQSYTNGDNATVKDGILTIELRKEKGENGGDKYTSTRIKTANSHCWKYGKIEMSAKLPSGKGTWPAFWMMPKESAYGGWPDSGEIDIMEFVGYTPGIIYNTIHCDAFNGADGTQKGFGSRIEDCSEAFHTYAVEWLPDKMIFTVDGEETFTYDPNEFAKPAGKSQWPYDKEFYIILNFAWGGNWGGARGTDDSVLPQTYQIDYVRVYQSKEITALTANE